MKEWEYKLIVVEANDGKFIEEFEREMNELGKEGWEAFSIPHWFRIGETFGMVVALKRPKI